MEELKDQIIGEVNKQVFQEYRNLIDSKDKEIERLNNIIEELEEYCKYEYDLNKVYLKIRELKERK